jgi:hypothetical protein
MIIRNQALVSLERSSHYRFKFVDEDLLPDSASSSWCAGAALVLARGAASSRAAARVARLDAGSECARGFGISGLPMRPPLRGLWLAGCPTGWLDQLDLVLHDGGCSSESVDDAGVFVEALGVDLSGLREDSQGWDDDDDDTKSSSTTTNGEASSFRVHPTKYDLAFVVSSARDLDKAASLVAAVTGGKCVVYVLGGFQDSADADDDTTRRVLCDVVGVRAEAFAQSMRDAALVEIVPKQRRRQPYI